MSWGEVDTFGPFQHVIWLECVSFPEVVLLSLCLEFILDTFTRTFFCYKEKENQIGSRWKEGCRGLLNMASYQQISKCAYLYVYVLDTVNKKGQVCTSCHLFLRDMARGISRQCTGVFNNINDVCTWFKFTSFRAYRHEPLQWNGTKVN